MPRFRALQAEVLMVAPTTQERGRFYARNFQLPFPYLCDPDYRVYEAYAMPPRRRSLLWKAQVFTHAIRMPQVEATELGVAKPALSEMPRMFNDDDLGFFIIDKATAQRGPRQNRLISEGDRGDEYTYSYAGPTVGSEGVIGTRAVSVSIGAVAAIAGDVTTQYIIRYIPDLGEKPSAKVFRNIRVSIVNLPSVRVRARKGYYPANP